MNIVTFTTVKDEEDIIESFVRYNSNIVDKMVILDNCSNDNTLVILKKLQKEKLNIDIIEDKNPLFDEVKIKNFLLKYTFDKYNPDFAIPLDADEFIATYDNINPREILEKLNKNYLHKYKMINYVISKNDNPDELFIPLKLKYKRDNLTNEDNTYKCFISNNIYNDDLKLLMGCHSAYYKSKKRLPINFLNNIFIAHYPIRNKNQTINKVIIGRLNSSSLYSRKQGLGFHQYEILDEVIKKGDLSDKSLYYFAKYYCVNDIDKISKITKKPINLSFCKNINIKYNKFNKINLLSNTIKISEKIIDRMRDNIEEKERENILLQEKYNDLYNTYNNILNSKRWIFISKICNFIKRK